MKRQRNIAVIWAIEDVLSIRPDLNEEEAWTVLQTAKRFHDADIGLNWSVLECHAEMLFGDAPDDERAEEELP